MPVPKSILFQRLKTETQTQHDALESASHAGSIMAHTLTLDQYVDLVVKNHFCYQQLEPQLEALFPQESGHPLAAFASRRADDLAEDLNLLSVPSRQFAWTYLPPELDLASLIGALYVLEGSRLGGKVIVRALQKNLHLASISRFHFFEQTGIETGPRWLAFQQAANHCLADSTAISRAVESAKRMFQSFQMVYEEEPIR